MKIDSLEKLLQIKLQKLYDMEQQLVKAIPQMAKKANDEKLRESLEEHLDVTKNQAQRLEEIAKENDIELEGMEDNGLAASIKDAQMMLENAEDDEIIDTLIIGGTAKIEHYEMASYEAAISLAQKLGKDEIADALQETYDEEKEAADMMSAMSSNGIIGNVAQALT